VKVLGPLKLRVDYIADGAEGSLKSIRAERRSSRKSEKEAKVVNFHTN
jgi:hypothetical protein